MAAERTRGKAAHAATVPLADPATEYQRCLVHQVRNTLKYVSDKDRKAFAKDLKTIYNAPSEQEGREALDEVTAAWEDKYPRAMKRWYDNWDAISPIFKFSSDVRTVIYTTNAIESLNSTYRRLNSQRSVFPSDTALLKALYLSDFSNGLQFFSPLRTGTREANDDDDICFKLIRKGQKTGEIRQGDPHQLHLTFMAAQYTVT